MMKIDLTSPNPALQSIFRDPGQIITLDANFLISPDRPGSPKRSIDFPTFQRIWLDPIFEAFPKLAIHEAVYDELLMSSIRAYITDCMNAVPPRLIIHRDSTLNAVEQILRDTIEEKIYPLTMYDPLRDNKDDRGEVKSLAYIAVKELLYFASHDSNAIQLVEKAEEWSTGLDNIQAINIFELIFYLYRERLSDKNSLRFLYKYYYHYTKHDKEINPEWGQFIETMDKLYLIESEKLASS